MVPDVTHLTKKMESRKCTLVGFDRIKVTSILLEEVHQSLLQFFAIERHVATYLEGIIDEVITEYESFNYLTSFLINVY